MMNLMRVFITLSIVAITHFSLAKNYNDLSDLIKKESGQKTLSQTSPKTTAKKSNKKKLKRKKITLKKDPKDGSYIVSWKILAGFNTKSNKPTKTISKILDQKVTIRGFMIPLDYSKRYVTEFLFVPYIPNCEHVPPPAPQLTINVVLEKSQKVETSYYPLEIKGILSLDKTQEKGIPYMSKGVFALKATKIQELKD